ncbi:hypothetical protein DL764_001003 [Monosporascus ibericus]|uniref:Uncharacterized protein n=1 Tax=Monosporascus ibericus TaxID=155417 RepID=A0A4V1XCI5_9PEZI|nr:hypothetical protein DL764_001003 [Monosporascus ibericus]
MGTRTLPDSAASSESTMPGSSRSETRFQYQAPSPSILADFDTHDCADDIVSLEENSIHRSCGGDAMGGSSSKQASWSGIRYVATDPDMSKLPIRGTKLKKQLDTLDCPECHATMGYEDVEKYADRETFAKHQVRWHEQLTCAEYDSFVSDPKNFRSRIDILNEEAEKLWLEEQSAKRTQEEADRKFAQSLMAAEQRKEAERQAQRERAERERREEAERRRLQAERMAKQQQTEKMRMEAVRKREEDELSRRTVERTTKPCPGCRWPIEKNSGCSHMTFPSEVRSEQILSPIYNASLVPFNFTRY